MLSRMSDFLQTIDRLREVMATYHHANEGLLHVGDFAMEALPKYHAMGFQRILVVHPSKIVIDQVGAYAKANGIENAMMGVHAIIGEEGMCPINPEAAPWDAQESAFLPSMPLDRLYCWLRLDPSKFNYLVSSAHDEIRTTFGARAADVVVGNITPHERHVAFPHEGRFPIKARKGFISLWQAQGGRFGNQLFNYFFADKLARHHGCDLRTGAWVGEVLFGLKTMPLSEPAPTVEEHSPRPEDSKLWQSMAEGMPRGAIKNVHLWGNFQFDTGLYTHAERERFCRMFEPEPSLQAALEESWQDITKNQPMLGVHIRRGDYMAPEYKDSTMFYATPVERYAEAIKNIGAFDEFFVYLATDDPAVADELRSLLPGWKIITAEAFKVQLPKRMAYYLDFWALTQVDALVISNSSFSFAAAMLNENSNTFYRPTKEGTFVEFIPWNAPVLLGRYEQVVSPAAGGVGVGELVLPPAFTGAAQQIQQNIPSSEEQCLQIVKAAAIEMKLKALTEIGLGTFDWWFQTFEPMGFTCIAVEPMPCKGLEAIEAGTSGAKTFSVLIEGAVGPDPTARTVTFYPGRLPDVGSTEKTWWGVDADLTESIVVPNVPMDGLVIRAHSILKLDMEGAERNAIAQLRDVEVKPKIVVFEYGGGSRLTGGEGWSDRFVKNTNECIQHLLEMGYEIRHVIDNGKWGVLLPEEARTKPEVIWATIAADSTYGNMIAFLRE